MPGAMVHSAEDIIRQLVIELGEGTSGGTWPVRVGNEPDRPDNHITVTGNLGSDLGITMPDKQRQTRPGFQVRVRAVDHRTGFTKAHAIAIAFDAVYQQEVTVLSTTYVIHAIQRGNVLHLGNETPQSKRQIFVFNGETSIRQLS